MCGITGIINYPTSELELSEDLLDKMAAPLINRGPDQQGLWIDKSNSFDIGFAHKRLSIIDTSELGIQPMLSYDKNISLVFNGEIYNYRDLKNELTGYNFKSNSDTEVIIAGYLEWGEKKLLEKLNGMFAIALFDKSAEKLIIARDKFGEKPCYYFHDKKVFAFSSDIRSFYELKRKFNISKTAFSSYLSELCTPSNQSIWEDIKKVPPGKFLILKNNTINIKTYWDINYFPKTVPDRKESLLKIESLIEDSVKQKMVSDVPVGCFLSGGIDSSLISLFAAKNYSGKIKTFSVGFKHQKFNELPFAKEVAQKIDSDHHEIIIDAKNLEEVNSLIQEYGEPFADYSMIPSYFLSKFAAKHVKVALGGDGGDEIFAGYRTYNQGLRMQQWYNLRKIKPLLAPFKNSTKGSYLSGIMDLNSEVIGSALYRNIGFQDGDIDKLTFNKELSTLVSQNRTSIIDEAKNHAKNPFDLLLYASLKTRLPNDYLVKTDRASMANSLELRTPFLDQNLLEYSSKLNYDDIMNKGENKYLLKCIAKKHFGYKFVSRPKMGFGLPLGEWIKRDWAIKIKEVIFEKNNLIDLNYDFIEKLYKEHIDGVKDHTQRLWGLYVFNIWSRKLK